MGEGSQGCGCGLIELAVVLIVGLVLVCVLVPALFNAIEMAHSQSCIGNLSQIGKALLNYESTKGEFPPSCLYAPLREGVTPYETWSWQALILPEMDEGVLYRTLDIRGGAPWQEREVQWPDVEPHRKGRETVLPAFICPWVKRKDHTYRGPIVSGIQRNCSATLNGALTNYKAIGGTFKESLSQSISPNNPKPPYGTVKDHPDGVMFPAARGTRSADILDGQSYTILVGETLEAEQARWMIGTEATMAGLPSADDPAGCGVTVEFDKARGIFRPTPSQSKFKTYLNYDYAKNYYDRTSSPEVKFGPSSVHQGVNHVFADGYAREISRDIDPAIYMSLITKAGKEKLEEDLWRKLDRQTRLRIDMF